MSLVVATCVMTAEEDKNAKTLDDSNLTTLIKLDKLKAFPTAEGAGAESIGGRKGDVIYVTNHDASGEGSLRWALSQPRARTILFAVGGRFNIDENILLNKKNQGNVTLAGQTANDIGGVHLTQNFNICNSERAITVRNQNNLVFRYFDSRYNWQYLLKDLDISGCPIDPRDNEPVDYRKQHLPTLRFTSVQNLVIDHISSGWSTYGLIVTSVDHSNIKTGNITIQRSLMHENFNNPEVQNHNVGMLLGTASSRKDTKEQWNNVGDYSVHKNAFIGVSHRLPNTAGGDNAKFRVLNNYIYGFKGDGTANRLSRIGGNSKNDFVNNVYQEATYGSKFNIDGTSRKGDNANNLLGFSYGSFLPMKKRDGLMKDPDHNLIERPNFYLTGNLFLDDKGEEKRNITSRIKTDPTLMTFRYQSYDHDGGYWVRENGKRVYKDDELTRKEFEFDGTHLQYGPRVNKYGEEVYDHLIVRKKSLSLTNPLANPVLLLAANNVKTDVLNNVGGNIRFRKDGSTYIDDSIDRRYIDWATKYTGPSSITKTLNDGGAGSHKDFAYPNYENGRRNLDTYDNDEDGIPDKWEKKHHLTIGEKDNNKVRSDRDWKFDKYLVRNSAGYTNLEMYLADIAGDFHLLAKTEGIPIKSHNDTIKISSIPSTIAPSSTVEAWIEYSANGKRDIKCYLKNEDTNKLIAFDKQSADAGTNKAVACELKIPTNTVSGDNYLLYTYITKRKGKWSERFDDATKKDIKISALTDDLTGIYIPYVIKVSDATLIYNITYSAKDTRDIKCYLKNSSGKVIGFDSKSVSAGIGTLEELDGVVTNNGTSAVCTFNLPNNLSEGDYSIYTYMTKSNGKWSERFDDETRAIRIEK